VNILMVLSSHGYPPDRRVEREARDLIRDGHKLFLMARRGPDQPVREVVDGVQVIRFPVFLEGRGVVSGLIFFLLHRYFILFRILRACRRHRIEALHVHDLPYAFAVTLAGRLLDIPVVFDMHEHYTLMLKLSYQTSAYRKFRFLSAIQLTPLRIEESIACRWAKKVIVVADEHVSRVHRCGARRENIVVVTNTEDIDYFSGLPTDKSLMANYRDDFVLLYIGGFSPHRGLDTAIEAMPAVLEKIPNARLLLIGAGTSRPDLERLAERMGLNDRITFVEFQPFETLPSYIRLSDVGLIPHISTPHIETTMPNKIFHFMILGKPVVVSSTRPMMRVVYDADCGLVFQERNPQSLADAVIQLADEDLRRRLGENGKRAAEDRYNWRETVQALLRIYRAGQVNVKAGSKQPQKEG